MRHSKGRVDSIVIRENEVSYRFTKVTINESVDIVQESSPSITVGLDECRRIASYIRIGAGTAEVEGSSTFKPNPEDVNGE